LFRPSIQWARAHTSKSQHHGTGNVVFHAAHRQVLLAPPASSSTRRSAWLAGGALGLWHHQFHHCAGAVAPPVTPLRRGCGTTSYTTAAGLWHHQFHTTAPGPWWGCRCADRCNRPPHPLHCSVCVVIPAVAMEAVQGPLPAFTSLWVRAASVVLATHFSACFLPFVPACPLPCLSALHPAGCLPTDWPSGRFADWK